MPELFSSSCTLSSKPSEVSKMRVPNEAAVNSTPRFGCVSCAMTASNSRSRCFRYLFSYSHRRSRLFNAYHRASRIGQCVICVFTLRTNARRTTCRFMLLRGLASHSLWQQIPLYTQRVIACVAGVCREVRWSCSDPRSSRCTLLKTDLQVPGCAGFKSHFCSFLTPCPSALVVFVVQVP